MAHSIQEYKGKIAIINDLQLIIIIGVALQIIDQSGKFESFRTLAEAWKDQLYRYGPGVIDLKLELFIPTPEKLKEFRALLEEVVTDVSTYGSAIPADVLNSRFSIHGIKFYDNKVSFIREAIKQLQGLVDGS